MSMLIRVASGLAAIIFASQTPASAQTYGPVVKLGMQVDENTMADRRTHYVAPVYSDLARASHIQGSVVMNANIDSRGKVIGLQTISGNPVLVRAALDAAMQWQYEPMLVNGQAVSVDTTITIAFSLTDAPPEAAPLAATAPSAVIIHLQNGRMIHADTSREDGDKIEYTIGEGIYRINKPSVKDIVQGTAGSQTGAPSSSAATHANANSNSSTVTASPLAALPRPAGEDPANWRIYESTEQLRAECRNGDISKYVHPEFQSTSTFPISKDEEARECAMLNVEMDPDYEQMIDRGVELEKRLCIANGMGTLNNLRPELKATADVQELLRIEVDFHNRMDAMLKQQPVDRAKGQRTLLDFYRLTGTCGHGSV